MARPRRSEHTREALIAEGIEQLSMYGYHGTGIKQILDEVKVPKGSFYNFFASKEAFVAEVIHEYSQDLLQQLNGFLQQTNSKLGPTDQLRSIYQYSLAKYAESQCQKTCLVGAMAVEIGSESDLCRQAMEHAVEIWLAVFTSIFRRAQEVGEMRSDISAQQLASVYWSTWEGALLKMKMAANTQSATETMELMLGTLLKAPA